MSQLTKEDLIRDLRALGLSLGDLVNVKASLRAVGEIKGGVDTLIDALIEVVGPTGTIVTDSFVDVYSPFGPRFWTKVVDQDTRSYAGGLANAILQRSGVCRSKHPVQKFALLGFLARDLAEQHNAGAYAYEILRLMAASGGKNLKIGADEKVPGVGTTHVAIGLAGLRQKRPLAGVRYRLDNGKTKVFYRNWSGGCMKAFYNLNAAYEQTPSAIIGRGKVGLAPAKLTSMKETLAVEQRLIQEDVSSFLRCTDPLCVECRFSWEVSHDRLLPFIIESFRHANFKLIVKALLYKVVYSYPFGK